MLAGTERRPHSSGHGVRPASQDKQKDPRSAAGSSGQKGAEQRLFFNGSYSHPWELSSPRQEYCRFLDDDPCCAHAGDNRRARTCKDIHGCDKQTRSASHFCGQTSTSEGRIVAEIPTPRGRMRRVGIVSGTEQGAFVFFETRSSRRGAAKMGAESRGDEHFAQKSRRGKRSPFCRGCFCWLLQSGKLKQVLFGLCAIGGGMCRSRSQRPKQL